MLRYGDDSQLPTPGLFCYAQGMPVVVTRNQFVGLKVVNGAPFQAVAIFLSRSRLWHHRARRRRDSPPRAPGGCAPPVGR